jgi:hypothetical protein
VEGAHILSVHIVKFPCQHGILPCQAGAFSYVRYNSLVDKGAAARGEGHEFESQHALEVLKFL